MNGRSENLETPLSNRMLISTPCWAHPYRESLRRRTPEQGAKNCWRSCGIRVNPRMAVRIDAFCWGGGVKMIN